MSKLFKNNQELWKEISANKYFALYTKNMDVATWFSFQSQSASLCTYSGTYSLLTTLKPLNLIMIKDIEENTRMWRINSKLKHISQAPKTNVFPLCFLQLCLNEIQTKKKGHKTNSAGILTFIICILHIDEGSNCIPVDRQGYKMSALAQLIHLRRIYIWFHKVSHTRQTDSSNVICLYCAIIACSNLMAGAKRCSILQ